MSARHYIFVCAPSDQILKNALPSEDHTAETTLCVFCFDINTGSSTFLGVLDSGGSFSYNFTDNAFVAVNLVHGLSFFDVSLERGFNFESDSVASGDEMNFYVCPSCYDFIGVASSSSSTSPFVVPDLDGNFGALENGSKVSVTGLTGVFTVIASQYLWSDADSTERKCVIAYLLDKNGKRMLAPYFYVNEILSEAS